MASCSRERRQRVRTVQIAPPFLRISSSLSPSGMLYTVAGVSHGTEQRGTKLYRFRASRSEILTNCGYIRWARPSLRSAVFGASAACRRANQLLPTRNTLVSFTFVEEEVRVLKERILTVQDTEKNMLYDIRLLSESSGGL